MIEVPRPRQPGELRGHDDGGFLAADAAALHDLSALLAAGQDSEVAWQFETGPSVTRGELRRLAASWPTAGSARGKLLIAIVADGSRCALRDLVCALSVGHAVILVPPDSPEFLQRVQETFDPHLVAGRDSGKWILERRHRREVALHPELALMLSTSGSTGENKFVRLSYRNLLSNAQSIVQYLGLNAAERGLMNLPLHYSYGLSIVTSHLLCGASLLVTSRSASDPQLWSLFDQAACTSIAGVPHSYALMAASGLLERALPSLRMMTQAGGRLPEPLARQFAHWCRRRGADFFIMYGQTEASPRIAYLPPEAAVDHHDCIGKAIPGGELTLQDEHGAPIREPGVEGELVYRGANVMMGYATTQADLGLPPGPAVLRTGDRAVIDAASSFVRLTGRTNRFLKLFGLRISLDQVERRLEQAGFDALCTGNDDLLGVVTRRPAADHETLRRLAAQIADVPLDCVVVCGIADWPKLPSGKTDHRALKAVFEKAAGARNAQQAPERPASPVEDVAAAADASPASGSGPDAIRRIYEDLLGLKAISVKFSFKDLGGDSLTYVRASIALQRLIPGLPRSWPSLAIESLQRMVAPPSTKRANGSGASLETSVLIRAIAPVLIVISHYGHDIVAGGAVLLMMVVGFNVSRFMVDHMVEDRWGLIARNLAVRVLIPYWLVLVGFGVTHGGVSIFDVLLVGNLMGGQGIDPGMETWFVETTAQSMLLLYLLTRFRPMRQLLTGRPFAATAGLVLFGALLRAQEPLLMPGLLAANQGREFTWTFWLFAVGLLVHAAHSPRQRIGASGVLLLLSALFFAGDTSRIALLSVGGLLLVWVDRVNVPRVLVPVLGVLASASLFIYLLHFRAPEHLPTSHWHVDILRVCVGIGLGVAGWWIYERFSELLTRQRLRLRAQAAPAPRIDL